MQSLKKSTLILFFWLTLSFAYGQGCANVFEIGQPPIFNASGLGVTFTGIVADDGYLYFRGSVNGTRRSIWKSDGTAAGTTMVIQEANTFGNNWDNTHFVKEGVFIQDDEDWMFLAAGDNQITMLPSFEQRDLNSISNGLDGVYYFSGDGTIEYDIMSNSTKVISTFESNELSQGELALLFGSYIYLKGTEEVLLVRNFLSTLNYETNVVNAASVYGKYLYVSFTDTSGPFTDFKDVVFNLETNEESNISGIVQGDITHIENEDFVYFIGSTDVVKVDKNQFSASTVYEDKFPFSPMIIFNDQLMLAGENPNFNNEVQVVSIDVNTDQVNYLTNAPLGVFFYNSRFLEFENNFYYIAEEGNSNVLNVYNFQAEEPVRVDVLSVVTGATVRHGLEKVQGQLVSSRRYNNLQHELAFCDGGIVSVDNPTAAPLLSVFPSPAFDYLEFSESDLNLSGKEVRIYDMLGSTSDQRTIDSNGLLNVSDLIPGLYFGTLMVDGENRSFKFFKG